MVCFGNSLNFWNGEMVCLVLDFLVGIFEFLELGDGVLSSGIWGKFGFF